MYVCAILRAPATFTFVYYLRNLLLCVYTESRADFIMRWASEITGIPYLRYALRPGPKDERRQAAIEVRRLRKTTVDSEALSEMKVRGPKKYPHHCK